MNAIPFDTQKLYVRLRDSGMLEEHAEALVYAMVDIINEMRSNKAAVAKTELPQPLAELKWEIIRSMIWILSVETILLLTLLPMLIVHR